MAKLKITCSNRCVLAKLDALGEGFDQPLQYAKEKITSENLRTRELQNQGTAQEMNERIKNHLRNCQPGFTIGFDNIDFEIPRKNMTLGKQNQDLHWVNHLMFVNKVSGNLLSNDSPRQDLQTVSNITFLPSASDQLRQRYNYIVLISRILVEYFDSLQPLKNACIQHMPHKYTEEMSKKSIKVINHQIVCINGNAGFFLFVCLFVSSIIFLKQYIYIMLHIFIIFFTFYIWSFKHKIVN